MGKPWTRALGTRVVFPLGLLRWQYRRGIDIGGLVGQGTGRESLGKQYLYGDSEGATGGSYQVEGGYASIAVEWGAVGLALWTLWTLAWLYRQWRCIRAAPSGSLPRHGSGLVGLDDLLSDHRFFRRLAGLPELHPQRLLLAAFRRHLRPSSACYLLSGRAATRGLRSWLI